MSDRKIRILQIVPALNVDSGVASFIMNYLRRLDHEKFVVDFAMYKKHKTPYYKEIKDYGGKIYLLPPVTSFFEHQKKCEAIIGKNKYDIIHDNTLTKSLFLMRSAYVHKVPVRILHSHNANIGDSKRKKFVNRTVLLRLKKYSTDFVACSKAAGNCYFEEEKYTVLPNIIDETQYVFDPGIRNNVRNKMNVHGKIVICTVGRMAQQKNPFFALDIIKEISENNPDVVYWWIGTGSIADDVREYSHKLGLDSVVTFLGARTDMTDLYQAMDIFFLPSLFEGLPVTGVEEQAMGLPAVISDTVTKEMVYTDLINYVPLNDPVYKWVDALNKQIQRIPKRRSYTDELRNSSFSSENAGQRLETLYENLLKEQEMTR